MSAITIIQLAIVGGMFYYISTLQDNKVEDVDLTAKPEPEKIKPKYKIPEHLPTGDEWKNLWKSHPEFAPKFGSFGTGDFSKIHPPKFDFKPSDFPMIKIHTNPLIPQKHFVKL